MDPRLAHHLTKEYYQHRNIKYSKFNIIPFITYHYKVEEEPWYNVCKVADSNQFLISRNPDRENGRKFNEEVRDEVNLQWYLEGRVNYESLF